MANKIVGNVVGVPSPHTDFNQTDETKGDYLKNRDQIITVNDVLSSLSDDELYLEGHRTIPCADAVKMYVNGKLADVASGITDLGTYRIEFDPNIGDFIINELDDYNKALKDAKQTGIYKITLIEASIEQPSLLITLEYAVFTLIPSSAPIFPASDDVTSCGASMAMLITFMLCFL